MDALKIIWLILIVAVGCRSQNMQSGDLSPMEFEHQVPLDLLGNFIMMWTPSKEKIDFEIHVTTTGYVGFGFSPNGGMTGSDVIIAGVDDDSGEAYLTDRYVTGYRVPEVDEIQDVTFIGADQNDTHTILRFSRPWNTCDKNGQDLVISPNDTIRVIWAYGGDDPKDGDPMDIRKHSERGAKSLFLNERRFQLPPEALAADMKNWEIRSPNVQLPDDLTTLYWCKLFKVPPLPNKVHVRGFVPLVAEDNILHVHHVLLYECHIPESEKYFEKWVDVDGAQCYGPNMPVSWMYCTRPLIAWAIGGEGSFFPEHVGFPMGEEHGGATYFLMEMHYDNPNLRQGVVDNSGLRIYYTEKLREYDASVLMLGHTVRPSQIIPPGQEEWLNIGICGSDCTEKNLPDDGINVFSGILHSHLLGRTLILRHIRDGKELPVILKDLNYDFNFQEGRSLPDELNIKPGDTLLLECGQSSKDVKDPTFGGFSTEEEMCLSFLYYYPSVDLAFCASNPIMPNILEAFGIEELYPGGKRQGGTTDEFGIDLEAEANLAEQLKTGGDTTPVKFSLAEAYRGVIIKSPPKYENQSLYDVLYSRETWEDPSVIQKLQENIIEGNQQLRCDRTTQQRGVDGNGVIISYPEFEPLPPREDMCSMDTKSGEDDKNKVDTGNKDTKNKGPSNRLGAAGDKDPQIGVWRPTSISFIQKILGQRPKFF